MTPSRQVADTASVKGAAKNNFAIALNDDGVYVRIDGRIHPGELGTRHRPEVTGFFALATESRQSFMTGPL
jgi:hypothetical protein